MRTPKRAHSHPLLAPTLLNEFPEIETVTRLAQENTNDNSDNSDLTELYFGQKSPGEKAGIFAPEMLTFETHDSTIISQDELVFIKNSSIIWNLFLLGYMNIMW